MHEYMNSMELKCQVFHMSFIWKWKEKTAREKEKLAKYLCGVVYQRNCRHRIFIFFLMPFWLMP